MSLFIIGHMGLFFYTKISSIISIGDLPTTNIIEPNFFCWTDLKNFESFLKEFLKNFKNYEMLLTGDEKGGRTGSIKKESRKRNE
ncbi:TPA: hypothetical protein VV375_000952 [Streptococcus pneumoniae]|nr:hypothetical protein [Streptococcus pneumoniae]